MTDRCVEEDTGLVWLLSNVYLLSVHQKGDDYFGWPDCQMALWRLIGKVFPNGGTILGHMTMKALLSVGWLSHLQIPADIADFLQCNACAPFCPGQAVGGKRPGLFQGDFSTPFLHGWVIKGGAGSLWGWECTTH